MTPTIRSQTFPNIDSRIQWNEGGNHLELKSTDVHVWNVEISEHFQDLFKRFRNLVSHDEYHKAKKLHWANDFKRYLTGRIILRILLGRYLSRPASEISFQSRNGKLYLLGSPLKFNLSYSDRYIVISFGMCETGIDVENIRPEFDFNDILNACFSKDEIDNIDKDSALGREQFFLQWTRKEALLKYTGQGIIDDLTIVPSSDGVHNPISNKLKIKSDIQLISFNLNHNCVGSLAYPANITNVNFLKWQS